MSNTSKRRGRPARTEPRHRIGGTEVKPIASGQVSVSENEQLNELCNDVDRTRSYVVRAAVLLLIKATHRDMIDWSEPPENWLGGGE
jgi:hypothetical protein